MIRTLLISFLALFLTESTSSQCVISVPSTTGYTVNITLTPTSIVAPSLCLNGYNYNVAINYVITFTGSNIPRRLYTLQATLGCGASSHFFSLPKSPAVGSLVTQSNVWTNNTNCATATLASFGCNTFNVTIEGPGIPQQVISCNLPVPCRAGNNAPALSASTRSNVCPATTANLSTITASNTPLGAILQWHTATPATATNKVALPAAVGAGNY